PEFTYSYIYAFHMPLFFLISGSLAIDSTRANPTRALLSKIGSIAWPYLFWGMTFIALKPVIYRFMLSHPDDSVLQSFRQLLLGEASWFLWTLFLANCILIVASSKIPTYVLFLVSIIISFLFGNYNLGTVSALVHFMPFFTLGAMIGKNINMI